MILKSGTDTAPAPSAGLSLDPENLAGAVRRRRPAMIDSADTWSGRAPKHSTAKWSPTHPQSRDKRTPGSGCYRTGHATTVEVTRCVPHTRRMFHNHREVSAAQPLNLNPHVASHRRRRRAEGSQSTGNFNLGPIRASLDVRHRRQVDLGSIASGLTAHDAPLARSGSESACNPSLGPTDTQRQSSSFWRRPHLLHRSRSSARVHQVRDERNNGMLWRSALDSPA